MADKYINGEKVALVDNTMYKTVNPTKRAKRRKYIYSKGNNVIHCDSNCCYAKNIKPENLYGFPSLHWAIKSGYKFCSACGYKKIIEKYITTDDRNQCRKLFVKYELAPDQIAKMFATGQISIRHTSDVLYVQANEDKWIIECGEQISLLHNNYDVNFKNCQREFTGGFHKQKFECKCLNKALRYCLGYTYEKHLKRSGR